VEPGETLSSIAATYETTVNAVLALNPETDADNLQVGTVLLIPAGPITPTPTATLDPSIPTPTTGAFQVHVVQQGETLSTIAENYGVSVAVIREANDLPINQETIIVNQALMIPVATVVPTVAPTVDPNATSTPLPLYPTPALLNPPDGAEIEESGYLLLQWSSVGILGENEWYEVALYDRRTDVQLGQTRTQATSWRIAKEQLVSIAAEAPALYWQVRVVREVPGEDPDQGPVYEKAGETSEVRTFSWSLSTPTPTLTSQS